MPRRWYSIALITFCALGAGNLSAQDELVNYGKRWNAWPDSSRSVYLEGFRDGQSHTYLAFLNDLSPNRVEPLRLQTFTLYETTAIRDVMTNLYSDPANTYITFSAMVYVARDKLSGKDIEPMLRGARANARGYVSAPK